MGKRSRRKGHTWERKIANDMRKIFGEDVRRGLQTQDGAVCCDVEGTPFWIEAKHMQLSNPRAALAQAIRDSTKAKDKRYRVAICKDDRKPKGWKVGDPSEPPVAVMLYSEWQHLIGTWHMLASVAKSGVVKEIEDHLNTQAQLDKEEDINNE
jgi:hypothetical protein